MSLQSIIKVNVSKQTSPTSSIGFGIPLLFSIRYDATSDNGELPFTDDFKIYKPTDNYVTQLGEKGDKEASFLQRVFGQSLVPTECVVGFKKYGETISDALTRINTANNNFYVICPIVTDSSTPQAPQTKLKDLIAINSWVSGKRKMVMYQDYDRNALSGEGLSVDITTVSLPDIPALDGNPIIDDLIGVNKLIGTYAANGTFPSDLGDDIVILTNKFVGLSSSNAKKISQIEYGPPNARVTQLVNPIALNRRLKAGEDGIIVQFYKDNETIPGSAADVWSDVIVTFVGGTKAPIQTLGNDLKLRGSDRAAVFWTENQSDYINGAVAGRCFPAEPGTITFAYKSLNGPSVSKLVTPTATSYLERENINYYTTIGGRNVIIGGQTASGEFIDITRGIDWLSSRIQENVFSYLATLSKIPYTDDGADILINAATEILDQAVGRGVIDQNYEITKKPIIGIPRTPKSQRVFPDINISVRAAGAIHKVEYNIVVTV